MRQKKKAKEIITVNACANVTGSIKLPLLFIDKAKKILGVFEALTRTRYR